MSYDSHEVLRLNTPEHTVNRRRSQINDGVQNIYVSLAGAGIAINKLQTTSTATTEVVPPSKEVSDYAAQRLAETAPATQAVPMSPEVAAYTQQMQEDRNLEEIERIREEVKRYV
jgi:hypothetical protein